MLEESLAEAGQLGTDHEWQVEVLKRMEQSDADQQRRQHLLSQMAQETRGKEEELEELMMAAEGRKVRGRMKVVW